MLIGIPTHQCPFILCTYLDESYTADPHVRTPKVFNLTRQFAPGAECLD